MDENRPPCGNVDQADDEVVPYGDEDQNVVPNEAEQLTTMKKTIDNSLFKLRFFGIQNDGQ